MIITIAFAVRNYVEVMESWPIKDGQVIFFLERDGNIVKSVCVSYLGVSVNFAPNIKRPEDGRGLLSFNIKGAEYIAKALQRIMGWQTVVSGLQVFDLDFDNYEIRYRAENVDEEPKISIKSFSPRSKGALNSACDFEQIGRAFCVSSIEDTRIESTSHFREGRIAFESGRYVDSYNNMFLFLETRYCDGKTKTVQQIDSLYNNSLFLQSFRDVISDMKSGDAVSSPHLSNIFDDGIQIKDKISAIVLLRGKLRHHSLKSPHRWDPNKQDEFEKPARFIGAVVGNIVLNESIEDLYDDNILKMFQGLSVANGFETRLRVATRRLEKQPSLVLEMGYPTTVVSSLLCATALINAIEACMKHGQLSDTVKLEATHAKTELEIFIGELDVWAYTKSRSIILDRENLTIICGFEHLKSNVVLRHAFSFPIDGNVINIGYAWQLLKFCMDRIARIDPTTRIMSLKLSANNGMSQILHYRVGAQVNF